MNTRDTIKWLFPLTDGVKTSDTILDFKGEFDRRFLDPAFVPGNETAIVGVRRDLKKIEEVPYKGTFSEIVDKLLNAFEECIKTIDPEKKYLFIHSSGVDSRIVSGTMLKLKRQGMNFDNVHFRAWGTDEKDSFIRIMQRGEWTNYSVIQESPDIYDIGREDICTGGWYSYTNQMNFWQDFDPSQTILMSGGMGEIVQFPAERWYAANTWFNTAGEQLQRVSRQFNDVFFPYLDMAVINLALQIHPRWRVLDARLGRDMIRTEMAHRLGMGDIPIQRPRYNWMISDKRKKQMEDLYYKSRFFKEFGQEPDIFPLNPVRGHGAKMWGFAVTVYEKI